MDESVVVKNKIIAIRDDLKIKEHELGKVTKTMLKKYNVVGVDDLLLKAEEVDNRLNALEDQRFALIEKAKLIIEEIQEVA